MVRQLGEFFNSTFFLRAAILWVAAPFSESKSTKMDLKLDKMPEIILKIQKLWNINQ